MACPRVGRGDPPEFSHLLVAADALSERFRGGSLVAACGAVLDPGVSAAEDDDPRYCPKWVRAAVRWNTHRTGR